MPVPATRQDPDMLHDSSHDAPALGTGGATPARRRPSAEPWTPVSLADRRATAAAGRRAITLLAGMLTALLLALNAPIARAAGEAAARLARSALAATADPGRGRTEFDRYCARCHGTNAAGDVNRRIPVLAGQRFRYLVRQLADLSTAERDGGAMHPALAAQAIRDPQTLADVALYASSATVPEHTQTGDGRHLGLGEATYRIECALCHHDDARGDDDGGVPSLRNQNFASLLSQMQRLTDVHRHNIDENVAQLLHSLKPDEARAVADYVSRMRGPRQ
jgi:cytochrome c553